MNNDRVNAAWGVAGPIEKQELFLQDSLNNRHSFPVIGCWDGKPFGYFEIYWVKEDILGRYVDSRGINNWDRGIHVLVGEESFRGEHRVKVWLSALVHYCWLADQRTENILVEPRVDNEKYVLSSTPGCFWISDKADFSHQIHLVFASSWLSQAKGICVSP